MRSVFSNVGHIQPVTDNRPLPEAIQIRLVATLKKLG